MAMCTIDECGRPTVGRGLCRMHYQRVRTYGDPHYCSRRKEAKIEIAGDIARVELTLGKWAIVDACDVEKVSGITWAYVRAGYALSPAGMYLHHLIVGKPSKGFHVDHINRDKLDNRRVNLRVVTCNQNYLNSDLRGASSGLVYTPGGRWKARIHYHGKEIHLGVFDTREEAAAFRAKAVEERKHCTSYAMFEEAMLKVKGKI